MASNKQLTALFRAIAAENFSGAADIAARRSASKKKKKATCQQPECFGSPQRIAKWRCFS